MRTNRILPEQSNEIYQPCGRQGVFHEEDEEEEDEEMVIHGKLTAMTQTGISWRVAVRPLFLSLNLSTSVLSEVSDTHLADDGHSGP
jgi:hypothetical protein